VRLLNYRKVRHCSFLGLLDRHLTTPLQDGSPFWNFLTIGAFNIALPLPSDSCGAIFTCFVMFTNLSPVAPVKLADGTVANYIGVQVDVSRTTEGDCAAFADGAEVQLLCVYGGRSPRRGLTCVVTLLLQALVSRC